MGKSNWNIDRRDKNQLMEEIFDTTTGHHHDGTDSRKNPYNTVVAGLASIVNNTVTFSVAVASIAASDIVVTSMQNIGATVAYVSKAIITAGTGFVITMNTACTGASVAYAVFKAS